jgi:hypothetical protein
MPKTWICEECGGPFHPLGGRQRWCRGCAVVNCECAHCGARFEVLRSEMRQGRGGAFCSRVCAGAAHAGVAHPRFNGGLLLDRGRWLIRCRDGSHVAFYRAVMAAHIGRLLDSDEHVHHRNGDPADDRIENLELVTRAEHMLIHQPELQAGRR